MLLSKCVCPDFLTQYSLFIFSIDFLYLFDLLAILYWHLEADYRVIGTGIEQQHQRRAINCQALWFPFWVKFSCVTARGSRCVQGRGKSHQKFGISPTALLGSIVPIFGPDFWCFKFVSTQVCTSCMKRGMHHILRVVWGICLYYH